MTYQSWRIRMDADDFFIFGPYQHHGLEIGLLQCFIKGGLGIQRLVQDGEADLGIAPINRAQPGLLVVEVLMDDELVVLCGPHHPLARRRRPLHWEALGGRSWLQGPVGSIARMRLDALTAGLEAPIDPFPMVTRLPAVLSDTLRQHPVLALLPRSYLRHQVDAGELVALPLAERLEALRRFAAAGPGYPLVLKPDIGQRGRGVAVIRSEAQAADYLAAAQDDVVAQRHIGGAEFGVFVYRDPNTARVELLSIVHKCFPTVTGDGRRSLGELILDDARARLIAQGLFERFASRLDEVPAAGDVVTLVEIGAHCRGSVFLDGAAYKTEALRQTMSAIVDAVPGYHFGRIDLRCPSEAALCEGRGIKVLELNGVTAESAHIYHPDTPLLDGWKAMIAQWRLAIAIGEANAASGAATTSLGELFALWRADLKRGERWF